MSQSTDSLSLDATILLDDGDLIRYICWAAGVFGMMALAYTFWWAVFTKCVYLKRYHYK